MSNEERKYNKLGTADDVAVELRKCREERKRIEKEERRKSFYCDHKDGRGRAILSPTENGMLECNRCRTEIMPQVQSLADVRRKCDETRNLVECLKISAEPEYVKGLAKIIEGIDSIPELYEKIILKGKKKRHDNNNNSDNSQRTASYRSNKL